MQLLLVSFTSFPPSNTAKYGLGPLLTVNQNSVSQGIERPDIRCPVCMAQTAREWKQAAQNLRYLSHQSKRPKSSRKNSSEPKSKLDAVQKLDSEDGSRRQAVCPQKEDKVGRPKVRIDVLETQERAKEQATLQQRRLAARQHQGCHKETIHGAIILKVYVIDDEQSRRQDDRQRSGLGSSSCRQGRGVDEHLQSIHQDNLR